VRKTKTACSTKEGTATSSVLVLDGFTGAVLDKQWRRRRPCTFADVLVYLSMSACLPPASFAGLAAYLSVRWEEVSQVGAVLTADW
jgi:hypothetical protein